MHEAFSVEVGVVVVHLPEKLLDTNILSLLHTSLHMSLMVLEVYLEHLVGYGKFARATRC